MPSGYQGLLATYQSSDGSGPLVSRVDPSIDFNWGNQGSPAPGIAGTNWTVTWQGTVTPTAGSDGDYTFYVTTDDGVRLWVDGQLVCDGWNYQVASEYHNEVPIHLVGGQAYSIRMDYFQGGGGEMAKLEWSSHDVGAAREVIPTANLSCADLVQNGDAVPASSVPGEQHVETNTPLTFSSANGNAIQVSDTGSSDAVPIEAFSNSFENPSLAYGSHSERGLRRRIPGRLESHGLGRPC